MNKVLGLILGVYVCIAVSCKQQSEVIKIPLDGKEDYTSVVYEALQKHKGGNVVLEFEQGVYNFYPEKALGKYIRVSNNDNGYKRIAFDMDGMKNVEVRGNNTEFLFHGRIVPFYINKCEDVSISGINIDYDASFILEGKVVANNNADKSIDLQLADNIKYEVRGTRFFYKGYDWEVPLGQNIVFDPSTNAPYYYTSKYLHLDWKRELVAQDLGNHIVRLTGFEAVEVPPVGSVYIDKGPYKMNRIIPGIILESSSNIKLSDMNIYMSGAMALIGQNTKNVTMTRFNVRLREGSGRYITASADATHFVNCKGLMKFEDCFFENMLDDATNIHGTYMLIDDFVADDCIAVQFGHLQQEGFLFASKGDTLQIIDRESLLPTSKFVVKAVECINDDYYLIRSEKPITKPQGSGQLAVENITNTTSVEMKGCTVRNNRARSILISTPKPVLIENNHFDSMMAGILIAGDANSWFESGNVGEVIIRNNTFVNMGKGGEAPQSILQISPEIPKEERAKGYYHGKIVFEGNTIKTFDSQVVYVMSVSDLTIRNNKFIQTKDYKPIYDNLSYIDVQNCKTVVVEGNSYEGDHEVEVSAIDCEQIKLGEQSGFNKDVVNKPNTHFYQQ